MRFERVYIQIEELRDYLDELVSLIQINDEVQFRIDEIRWRILQIESEVRDAEKEREEAIRSYVDNLKRCRRGCGNYLR